MKKLIRILTWIFFNLVVCLIVHCAINGNIGCVRLMKFIIWFNFIACFLVFCVKDCRDKAQARGASINKYFNILYGFVFSGALVYFGFVFYGVLDMFSTILQTWIFEKPEEKQFLSPDSDNPCQGKKHENPVK